MPMVLVIDDERTFKVVGADITLIRYARTSDTGIKMLKKDPDLYDDLFLDHDLGIGDTIMKVVSFLEEEANEGRHYAETIYVHSMNPVGAENVMRALKNTGYKHYRIPLPECV